MNRKLLLTFLALAALLNAASASDLPSAWRAWRYSRPVPTPAETGPLEIALPPDLLAHSDNHLADLRLIDDLGHEVPYIVRLDRGGDLVVRATPARMRENSYVPGQFTQVVFEIQNNSAFNNTIRIATPESDFINWVEVATSDDARLWRIVKARAPISRFRKEGLEGSQTVHFSDTASHYLRLRIFEPKGQFAVTGAEILASGEVRAPAREPVSASFQADTSAPPDLTRWQADLSNDSLPITEAVFTTTQPEFYRAVRILTSADGKEWNIRCGGEIYRYKLGEKTEESLRVRFSEDWGPRYWRVEVLNGNDAPLSGAMPSLILSPRRVFFLSAPDRSYRLIYGNAAATIPQYDIGHIHNNEARPATAVLSPGLEELTANYADSRPYSERHPHLLWLALVMAAALLGYAAFRALRTPTVPAE